jgi:hypothetical protein
MPGLEIIRKSQHIALSVVIYDSDFFTAVDCDGNKSQKLIIGTFGLLIEPDRVSTYANCRKNFCFEVVYLAHRELKALQLDCNSTN